MGESVGSSRKMLIAVLIAITADMLWNAGLGAYRVPRTAENWLFQSDSSGLLVCPARPSFFPSGKVSDRIVPPRVPSFRGFISIVT